MSENDEVKESSLEPVKEKPVVEHSTAYPDFVEGAYTREIAKMEGADEGKIGRVFKQSDESGDIVHISGAEEVVSDIGDTLEKGGYRVKEWHIKRGDDPSAEAERIRPATDKFVEHSPLEVADNIVDGVRQRLGLPSTPFDKTIGKLTGREEKEIEEATTELKEAIDEGTKKGGE